MISEILKNITCTRADIEAVNFSLWLELLCRKDQMDTIALCCQFIQRFVVEWENHIYMSIIQSWNRSHKTPIFYVGPYSFISYQDYLTRIISFISFRY